METDLLMNFSLNKETKTVNIQREFRAKLPLVWSAWTEAEILDQWWAPAPMKSKTKEMDFREGGRRFYAMISPEGNERWSIFKYTSITPKTNFKHSSTFCDAQGNPDPNFGSSNWGLSFSEQGDSTFVTILITRDNLEELERLIETGFKEGMNMILKNLDKVLEGKK